MKIQTYTIIVGTEACNAHCPFCVSKTTPKADLKGDEYNHRILCKGCRLAQLSGATTVLLTGKGEPTLYPDMITSYLCTLNKYDFPLIEIQTNGIALMDESYNFHLKRWNEMELNTICISAVSMFYEENRIIYGDKYPDLARLVDKIHNYGYSIRLSIMMLNGFTDSWHKVQGIRNFCKGYGIEQLTLRSIDSPEKGTGKIVEWIRNHTLSVEHQQAIKNWIEKEGVPVLQLAHGATIYDVHGQNLCLSNCLTDDHTDDSMRQLIYFPDGHLRYNWKYEGAILV